MPKKDTFEEVGGHVEPEDTCSEATDTYHALRPLVVKLDSEGRIIEVGQFTSEITGYAPEELIGKVWFEVMIIDEIRPELHQILDNTLAIGRNIHINPIRTKDGETRIIRWQNDFQEDKQGNPITVSTGIDVSAECAAVEREYREKVAESEALEEERELSAELTHVIAALEEAKEEQSRLQLELTEKNTALHESIQQMDQVIYELQESKELIEEMLELSKFHKYIILDKDKQVLLMNTAARAQFGVMLEDAQALPVDSSVDFGKQHAKVMFAINAVAESGTSKKIRITDRGSTYDISIKPKMNGTNVAKRLHINIHDVTVEVLRQEREASEEEAIMKIILSEHAVGGHLVAFSEEIGEIASETLNVDQVSVWRFSDGQSILECVNRFDRLNNEHTKGESLGFDENSPYIRALQSGRSLAVSDARINTNTSDLAPYLQEHNIRGMAGVPIICNQEIVGVICFEDSRQCTWHPDQIKFIEAIADRFAIAVKHSEVVDQQKAIVEQQREIMEQQQQEKLKKQKEQEAERRIMRRLLEKIPQPVYISNIEGKFVNFNTQLAKMFGFSEEESDDIDTHDLWENREDRDKHLKKLMKTGFIKNVLISLKRRNGETFKALWNAEVFYVDEAKTKIKYIQGSLVEISTDIEYEES